MMLNGQIQAPAPLPHFPVTLPSVAMRRLPPDYWDRDELFLRSENGSLTIIYASFSNLKTTFAACRAIGIAKEKEARVLYVVAEGAGCFGSLTLNAAVADWNASHGAAEQITDDWLDAHLHLVETPPSLEQLKALVKEQREWSPDIVILDTLGAVAAGERISTPEVGTKIGQTFRMVSQTLPCDLWAVHHLGKDQSAGPMGSQYYMNDADAALELTYDEKAGLLKVEVTKARWAKKRSLNFGVREVHGLVRPGWEHEEQSVAVFELALADQRRKVPEKQERRDLEVERVQAALRSFGPPGTVVTQQQLLEKLVQREPGESEEQFKARQVNYRKNTLPALVWKRGPNGGSPGPAFGFVVGVAREHPTKPKQPYIFQLPEVPDEI